MVLALRAGVLGSRGPAYVVGGVHVGIKLYSYSQRRQSAEGVAALRRRSRGHNVEGTGSSHGPSHGQGTGVRASQVGPSYESMDRGYLLTRA